MKHFALAAALGLSVLASAPADAANDQLRLSVKHSLNAFDPVIDVDALSDAQVVELFLVLASPPKTYFERRRAIRAVLQ